jgi:hypothetical protein
MATFFYCLCPSSFAEKPIKSGLLRGVSHNYQGRQDNSQMTSQPKHSTFDALIAEPNLALAMQIF